MPYTPVFQLVTPDKVLGERLINKSVDANRKLRDGSMSGRLFPPTFRVTFDIVSDNWDGPDPINLTVPAAITAGYALDSSLGSMQIASNLFVGTDTSYIRINGIGGGQDALLFHDEQGAGQPIPLVDAFIVHTVDDVGGGVDIGQLWLNSFSWSGQDGAAMILTGYTNTGTNPARIGFNIGGNEIVQINKISMQPGIDSSFDLGTATEQWKDLHIDLVLADDVLASDGSVTNPSHAFENDIDVGIYLFATGKLGFTAGSSLAGYVDSSGDWFLGSGGTGKSRISDAAGSLTFATFGFEGDPDTGMLRQAANELAFTAGGNLAAWVSSAGDWQMGSGGTGKGLISDAAGNVNFCTWSFVGDTNTGVIRVVADSLGLVTGGVTRVRLTTSAFYSTVIYSNTDAAAVNVVVKSDGSVQRSTSSLQYKPGWKFITDLADQTLPLPIRWVDGERERVGFGAEHVAALFPEAAEDENYDLRSIVAVCVAKLSRIENLLGV